MKIVRFYLAAVVITVVEFIISFATNANFFKWIFKLPPTNIWKPMQGPPTTEYYIGSLVINILFVLVYAIFGKGLPGEGLKKGFIFGFLVFLIGSLPGMFATYLYMNVAQEAVLYLTIYGLVVYLVKGILTAMIAK